MSVIEIKDFFECLDKETKSSQANVYRCILGDGLISQVDAETYFNKFGKKNVDLNFHKEKKRRCNLSDAIDKEVSKLIAKSCGNNSSCAIAFDSQIKKEENGSDFAVISLIDVTTPLVGFKRNQLIRIFDEFPLYSCPGKHGVGIFLFYFSISSYIKSLKVKRISSDPDNNGLPTLTVMWGL